MSEVLQQYHNVCVENAVTFASAVSFSRNVTEVSCECAILLKASCQKNQHGNYHIYDALWVAQHQYSNNKTVSIKAMETKS
jgi:predicted nucleic acid-binding protein